MRLNRKPRCRLEPPGVTRWASFRRGVARGTALAHVRGLSLVEVLITVAVIGILAGVLIPQLQADIPSRLQSAAQIVAADLEYARSLAVANGSTYRITFSADENSYYLEHSGASALLEPLPASPFRPSDEQVDRQTTALSELPFGQPVVELAGALRMTGTAVEVADVDFSSLGGTTRAEPTVVWLGCGSGSGRRYLPLRIHPVTGLVDLGEVTTEMPSSLADNGGGA